MAHGSLHAWRRSAAVGSRGSRNGFAARLLFLLSLAFRQLTGLFRETAFVHVLLILRSTSCCCSTPIAPQVPQGTERGWTRHSCPQAMKKKKEQTLRSTFARHRCLLSARASSSIQPVLMFSISPPCALNARFPAAANCDAAIKEPSTSAIWKTKPHTWPSCMRSRTFCWPRFSMRVPSAALCVQPTLDASLAWYSPCHLLLECPWQQRPPASFISYWARGTQCTSTILDPRSNLFSFSQGDRIVVFLSIPLACLATPLCTTVARVRQNSKPVCGTLLRRRLSPTYSWLTGSRHSSNPATTHRQPFLRSATQNLVFLGVPLCPPFHPPH